MTTIKLSPEAAQSLTDHGVPGAEQDAFVSRAVLRELSRDRFEIEEVKMPKIDDKVLIVVHLPSSKDIIDEDPSDPNPKMTRYGKISAINNGKVSIEFEPVYLNANMEVFLCDLENLKPSPVDGWEIHMKVSGIKS